MAWNEPTNPNRDPWSAGRRPGPPDLDEMLKRLRARFGANRGGPFSRAGVRILAIAAVAAWLALGFYSVDEQERAVILRFGAIARTVDPGLGWHLPPPIEQEHKVNVTRERSAPDKFELLTRDENLVSLEMNVHFRVSSPQEFLFSLDDPEETVRQASRAVMLDLASRSTMDELVSGSRQAIADRGRQVLQQRLDGYHAGVTVAEIDLQQVQPPDAVRKDFDEALKAEQDRKRVLEDARAYAEEKLPRARGAAARQIAEAASYRDRVIATAEGDAARFSALLAEYRKAPKVTRDRLYLDAMSDVLGRTSKVLLDVDKSGPVIYLPLEQLLRGEGGDGSASAPSMSAPPAHSGPGTAEGRSRDRGAR